MSKRKGQKVSVKREKQRTEEAWVEALESTVINDNHWWCIVTMMVETGVNHSRIVSLFNEAAESGKRKAIYVLSRQKAMSTMLNLARQDPGECSTLQTVCHYVSKLLSEGHIDESLPTWMMARVIKYLVYRAKLETISRLKREMDLELEVDEEYRAMQVNNFVTSKTKKGEQVNKVNTRLRKREENWRDIVYLNDEPEGGANLYVVLTGFHDPALPVELVKAGVPLTCLLRIKRPAENPYYNRYEDNGLSGRKVPRFLQDYRANQDDLAHFWARIEQDLLDREKMTEYSDVVFQTFCPPELPATFDAEEHENLKKDMYDRVSYIVYDLQDLWRQYVKYMRSMKLQNVEETRQVLDTRIYEDFLDNIPLECISVPVVLTALLIQVEAYFSDFSSSSLSEEEIGYTAEFESGDNSEQLEARLILHGDYLATRLYGVCLNERLRSVLNVDDSSEDPLVDVILPVLLDSRVTSLWRNRGESSEVYTTRKDMYQDNGVKSPPCGRLTLIDREDVLHYLHLLLFDEMMDLCSLKVHDGSSEEAAGDAGKDRKGNILSFLGRNVCQSRKWKSLPNVTSFLTSSFHRAKSDGVIDYSRQNDQDPFVCDFFVESQDENSPSNEYDYVEFLPGRVFLQAMYECFLTFDRLTTRYVEQTGSVLLYFHDVYNDGIVREESALSSVRTPICFREFCEYVRVEEEDWIRREEAENKAEVTASRRHSSTIAATNSAKISPLAEQCFILPKSLKARNLRGNGAFDKHADRRDIGQVEEGGKTKGSPARNRKDRGDEELSKANESGARRGGALKGTMLSIDGTGKSRREDIDTSFLPPRKILSVRCAAENEPSEFVGYNVDRFRLEVVSSTKTFHSADGCRVTVEINQWIRSDKELRITLDARDCHLHLPLLIRSDKSLLTDVFHFTSDKGVVLAFSRSSNESSDLGVSESLRKDNWRRFHIDFHGSWPSGLSIGTIVGDSWENPFYIRQSYVSAGPACEDVKEETCRKFLRNGTLLKYLNDGSVVVLRSNGVIVTCTAFEKAQKQSTNSHQNSTKGRTKLRDSRKSTSSKRRISERPSDTTLNEALKNETLKKLTTGREQGEFSSVDITGYTVFDYEGRRYDVLRRQVVREYGRTLVRSASDCEVDQKFIRRADGTNMLFESNGELTVCFNDGTRITTGYVIEEWPVTCDWSVDELERFYGYRGSCEESIESANVTLSTDKSRSTISSSNHEDEVLRILRTDSFVSVLLTCRFEHKNYARVAYDQSAVTASLEMPGDLRVSLSKNGHCEISAGKEISLKVEKESVTLSHTPCHICRQVSTSVCKLETTPGPIFRMKDTSGAVFEVDNAGNVRYLNGAEAENGEKVSEMTLEESSGPIHGKFEDHARCRHVKECPSKDGSARPSCRLFAMERNLTAREYLRRSVGRELEASSMLNDRTSTILRGIPGGSRSRFILTFVPFDPIERSKAWSQPYSVSTVTLRNHDRTDLLRSTYSRPYDWLFPFGKNDKGMSTNKQNVALLKRTEISEPKLLKVRVLQQFKEEGQSAVIELQKFLRNSVVDGYRWYGLADEDVQRNVIPAHDPLSEEDIRNIALAVKKTIGMETYVRGLQRKTEDGSQRVEGRSNRARKLSGGSCKDELEWYRKCRRENIIIPYFRNITGTCHLWVKSCAEGAVKTADPSQTWSVSRFVESAGETDLPEAAYPDFPPIVKLF